MNSHERCSKHTVKMKEVEADQPEIYGYDYSKMQKLVQEDRVGEAQVFQPRWPASKKESKSIIDQLKQIKDDIDCVLKRLE